MAKRRIYDRERHAHFVTFSCSQNPVRARLVREACDWRWSSARHYELGKSVGVKVGWIE